MVYLSSRQSFLVPWEPCATVVHQLLFRIMPAPRSPVQKAAPKPKKSKAAKSAAASDPVKVDSSDDDPMGVTRKSMVSHQTVLVDGVERLKLQPGDPVFAQDWVWCNDIAKAVQDKLLDEEQVTELVIQRSVFDELVEGVIMSSDDE